MFQLPANGIRPKHVKHFLDMSLKKLQLDYVDLYLIHCFFGFQHVSDDNIFPMENGVTMIDPSTDLIKTWKVINIKKSL